MYLQAQKNEIVPEFICLYLIGLLLNDRVIFKAFRVKHTMAKNIIL